MYARCLMEVVSYLASPLHYSGIRLTKARVISQRRYCSFFGYIRPLIAAVFKAPFRIYIPILFLYLLLPHMCLYAGELFCILMIKEKDMLRMVSVFNAHSLGFSAFYSLGFYLRSHPGLACFWLFGDCSKMNYLKGFQNKKDWLYYKRVVKFCL